MEELLPIIPNDGCFKIHRNKGSFILKFMKKKTLHYLEKSEDLSYLEDIRIALYANYGKGVVGEELDKDDVKEACDDISLRMRMGQYSVISARNEEEDDDYEINSRPKITIKKHKKDQPERGDFLIVLDDGERDIAIFTTWDDDYLVFLSTGMAVLFSDIEDENWYFANVTVEAE